MDSNMHTLNWFAKVDQNQLLSSSRKNLSIEKYFSIYRTKENPTISIGVSQNDTTTIRQLSHTITTQRGNNTSDNGMTKTRHHRSRGFTKSDDLTKTPAYILFGRSLKFPIGTFTYFKSMKCGKL